MGQSRFTPIPDGRTAGPPLVPSGRSRTPARSRTLDDKAVGDRADHVKSYGGLLGMGEEHHPGTPGRSPFSESAPLRVGILCRQYPRYGTLVPITVSVLAVIVGVGFCRSRDRSPQRSRITEAHEAWGGREVFASLPPR